MRLRNLFLLLLLCMTVGVFSVACTGDDGAQGPPGPAGPAGPAGPEGPEGPGVEPVDPMDADCSASVDRGRRFVGSNGDDVICGNERNNRIDGGDGDDIIYGRAGNDTIHGDKHHDMLYGGDGDDTLFGGGPGVASSGSDELYGEAGNDTLKGDEQGGDLLDCGDGDGDTVSYEVATIDSTTNTLYVSLAEEYSEIRVADDDSTTGVNEALTTEGDLLDDILNCENITGSASADILIGDAGANIINGGAETDILQGGAGDDTYVHPVANEITEKANEGTDTISYAGPTAPTDPLIDIPANVENYMGSDENDSITGNDSANVIYGGAGVDTIDGGAGDDTIIAGKGDDASITLGTGSDTVIYNKGDGMDTVAGFSIDDDKLVMRGFTAAEIGQIRINDAGSVVMLGADTLVTLTGVTTLQKANIVFE